MEEKLKVGVVGVGHLGSQHARLYSELPGAELVAVVDVLPERAREFAERHGSAAYTDFRDILPLVQAASIAVPTEAHHELAAYFLRAGVPVLVEKPLAKTLPQAEELCSLARSKGVLLAVGHVERFNPAVMAIQDEVRAPRFIECHRLSPFSFRSADIDVVLDLMIHDLDLVLHLVSSPLSRIDAVGVEVLSERLDIAHARLEFESGCVANLTASRVSVKSMRKLRVFSPDTYVSLDTQTREASLIRRKRSLQQAKVDPKTVDPSALGDLREYMLENFIDWKQLQIEGEEPLRVELESFLKSVREGRPPVVGGEHGLRAMSAAARVQEAILQSRRRME